MPGMKLILERMNAMIPDTRLAVAMAATSRTLSMRRKGQRPFKTLFQINDITSKPEAVLHAATDRGAIQWVKRMSDDLYNGT